MGLDSHLQKAGVPRKANYQSLIGFSKDTTGQGSMQVTSSAASSMPSGHMQLANWSSAWHWQIFKRQRQQLRSSRISTSP